MFHVLNPTEEWAGRWFFAKDVDFPAFERVIEAEEADMELPEFATLPRFGGCHLFFYECSQNCRSAAPIGSAQANSPKLCFTYWKSKPATFSPSS